MKKRKTRSLFVLEIVMLFLSILIIAPCLMMIFGSFKTALEANHFNIKPPSEWHFENYIEVFKEQCADGVDDCSGSRDFICSVLVCSC